MAPVKVGDRVRVADRETSAADAKRGLFYDYFRNLTGSVERVYEDNTVCVDVDIESLPDDVLRRHKEVETAARDKWIQGLSQEQRSRLTEADKQFTMRYKIVVAAADVGGMAGKAAKEVRAARSAPSAEQPVAPKERTKSSTEAGGRKVEVDVEKPAGKSGVKAATKADDAPKKTAAKAAAPKSTTEAKRLTEKDLAARELAHLKELRAKQGSTGKDGGK